MSKRRQGPINKRLDFINNKLNKYSIRKFTVGTASILVGATLIFGHADDEAKAAEENHMENTSLNSIENDEDKNNQKVDSSNETATTLTEKTTTKEAPSSEENTEDVTTKEAPSSEENTEDVTTKEDNTKEVATKEDNTEEVATAEEAQEVNNKSKQLLDMDKNSTIDEKIDYAKQTINELNINQNDISNIETSIKNNSDLKNLSKEELNNEILRAALVNESNNNDYGLQTLSAIEPLTTNVRNKNNSLSPVSKLRMLATATSGQNVNDKINITNASLTLNKKNN